MHRQSMQFNPFTQAFQFDPAWSNLFISFWLLLSIVVSVLVFCQRVFDKSSTVIGVFVWTCLNVRQFVLRPVSHYVLHTPLTPSAHVPNVLFIVLVTHTMLPLSRTTAVVLATTTSIIDLVLSGTMTDVQGSVLVLQVFMKRNICKYIAVWYRVYIVRSYTHSLREKLNF